MSVALARVVQWACAVLVALSLGVIFLAHAHGRAAADGVLGAVVFLIVGLGTGIAAKAQGVVHLRARREAEWEGEVRTRFTKR